MTTSSRDRYFNQREKAMTDTIKVGDIYYDIYGYDATLVDFYQVVRVISTKTVEIRKISRTYITDSSVQPVPNDFKSEPFQKRINKWGSFGYTKWDGKPKYISAFGTY